MRAFQRAAAGKRQRYETRQFESELDANLSRLSAELRSGSVGLGDLRRFVIHDPKRRVISAPAFRERVVHHALMHAVAPILERSSVDDSYACRVGRGSLAAVRRLQGMLRKYPVFVQVDVRRYFDSVDHQRLLAALARKIKGGAVLDLIRRIVEGHHASPGKGLPIGALTSQYFGNFYLAPFDRALESDPAVRGQVRYMDDVVWFCEDRADALAVLARVKALLKEQLDLLLNPNEQVQSSLRGLTFCGFRVLRGSIRLSLRRRRRFAAARRRWEGAWKRGWIESSTLQSVSPSILAITAHADARGWRRQQLTRRVAPEV